MIKKVGVIIFFIFLASCQTKKNNQLEAGNGIIIDSTKIVVSGIGITLNNDVKQKLNSWNEYQEVDVLISKYQRISIIDALTTSVELANSVKMLNDSIRIEELKIDEIKTRLAVLYNESLRLKDMSNITSIKQEEVTLEIQNVLEAFSAINAKINNVYLKKTLEEEEINLKITQ